MFWIAYSIMWMSVAAATAYGLYLTKNPNCLWALIIPTFMSFRNRGGDKEE